MPTPPEPADLPPPPDDELLDTKIEAEVEHEIEMEGDYEQPPGPLKYHYGDGTIIDAGTMIHDDCGGIISIIDNGMVCECGANADLPPPPTPSEETLQPFRDALARDTAHVTPEQLASDPLYKTIDARDLPPEVIGQPLFDKLHEARAATPEEQRAAVAAFDTVVSVSVVEESVLAPTCTERHVKNCECRGAARGPRP